MGYWACLVGSPPLGEGDWPVDASLHSGAVDNRAVQQCQARMVRCYILRVKLAATNHSSADPKLVAWRLPSPVVARARSSSLPAWATVSPTASSPSGRMAVDASEPCNVALVFLVTPHRLTAGP
jgi:hypothetical protein